jgi:hypothetical protein
MICVDLLHEVFEGKHGVREYEDSAAYWLSENYPNDCSWDCRRTWISIDDHPYLKFDRGTRISFARKKTLNHFLMNWENECIDSNRVFSYDTIKPEDISK